MRYIKIALKHNTLITLALNSNLNLQRETVKSFSSHV